MGKTQTPLASMTTTVELHLLVWKARVQFRLYAEIGSSSVGSVWAVTAIIGSNAADRPVSMAAVIDSPKVKVSDSNQSEAANWKGHWVAERYAAHARLSMTAGHHRAE